jgi:hypothetical protein
MVWMPSLFSNGAPLLPEFSGLLVKGPFRPSTPVNLALSHVEEYRGQNPMVLWLTPSYDNVIEALNTSDPELIRRIGTGKLVESSLKIQALYSIFFLDQVLPLHLCFSCPSTPADFSLLLSALQCPSIFDDKSHLVACTTTLRNPPSLIILSEMSQYFLSSESSESESRVYQAFILSIY